MNKQNDIRLYIDIIKIIATIALGVWLLTYIFLVFFNGSVVVERITTGAIFFTLPLVYVLFYGLIKNIENQMETINEEAPIITRLEVIDYSQETPRTLTVTADKIEYDLQDEGRTLKLFVNRKQDQQ